MDSHSKLTRRFVTILTGCLLMCCTCGCSSLGLSAWPAQFQLLKQTKQIRAAAPLPAGMPHELSKYALPDYFVEPGDRILIEPVNLDSEIGSLGDQRVQVDGTVDLGKFGRIQVAGLTVEDIEHAVESQVALRGDRESINVQLVESNAAEIYVLGEVGSPAAYPIDGHEHVLDAILRAGGLTSKASPCDIILVRPTTPDACRVVLPVCYRQITQLGDVTSNYQLQPGDRIVVGSRSCWEEFAFWKQSKECDRCCGSSCVECQPASIQYGNRFANRILPPSQPNQQVPSLSKPTFAVEEPTDAEESEDKYIIQPEVIGIEAGKADSDLFLPPLDNQESQPTDASDRRQPEDPAKK